MQVFGNQSGSNSTTVGFGEVAFQAANPVAAIPEPGTYALMFAGLAAVGLVARRRRV